MEQQARGPFYRQIWVGVSPSLVASSIDFIRALLLLATLRAVHFLQSFFLWSDFDPTALKWLNLIEQWSSFSVIAVLLMVIAINAIQLLVSQARGGER